MEEDKHPGEHLGRLCAEGESLQELVTPAMFAENQSNAEGQFSDGRCLLPPPLPLMRLYEIRAPPVPLKPREISFNCKIMPIKKLPSSSSSSSSSSSRLCTRLALLEPCKAWNSCAVRLIHAGAVAAPCPSLIHQLSPPGARRVNPSLCPSAAVRHRLHSSRALEKKMCQSLPLCANANFSQKKK
ncbi:unnamed protein product [Pleuronectes platessa]|uniref:Uncharacterized protein n=1 Tax=Pleuronectes platessa TaxID=8262 RepID=A0A9N7V527_PLEPL|nr:unnamed protein product [Pleuronectes platessa]